MKVKDLMEACKDLDPDMEVVIPDSCCMGYGDYGPADADVIDVIAVGQGWYDNAKNGIKVLKIW